MIPMLAHSYEPRKVKFPALVSPKLDGIRCLAHFDGETFSLWSRDEKPILSSPHIITQLNDLASRLKLSAGWVLDGEIFVADLPFQKVSGLARRKTPSEETQVLQYHIFDIAKHGADQHFHLRSYSERYELLTRHFGGRRDDDHIVVDENLYVLLHREVTTHDEILHLEKEFVARGLEGAIVRTDIVDRRGNHRESSYENVENGFKDRSWGVLKVKSFQDAEFLITGTYEEIDKHGEPKGRVAGFKFKDTRTGVEFQASGLVDEMKRDAWDHPEKYIGKMATVKYFGKSEEGTPRHPNFKAMREGVE